MYIIINKTSSDTTVSYGDFPICYIEDFLNRGDKLIVISLYSNTIKTPYLVDVIDGNNEWLWDEYPFEPKMLNQ